MLARPYLLRLAAGLATMTLLGALPSALPASAAATGADATRPLFLTNRDSSNIAAFSVDQDGRLTALGAPITTGTGPRGIVISPDGRAAYVANSIARTVSAYSIGAAGTLTLLGAPVATSGTLHPFSVAIAPDGHTLYVVSHDESAAGVEGDGALLTFAIRPDRTLAQIGAGLVTGAVHPRTLSLTPDGRFLFIGHGDPNLFQPGAVSRFAIGADGAPTQLGAPIPVGMSNGTLAMTPDGRFLYVPGEGSGEIFGFAVGGDGSLAAVPNSPLAQPDKPIGSTVTPDGRHLYVVSLNSDTLYAYTIGADGRLTFDATYPTGSQPDALAASPDGRYLYVANFGSDNLTIFRIEQDGVLQQVPGSPVPAGGEGPAFGSIAVLPNQGPVAAFSATARPKLESTRFDASASSDVDGQVARYDWDFGDGTVRLDGGPFQRHTYQGPGVFTVTLTVTDNEGCATHMVYTGRAALCTGSAAASVQHTVTVRG
jgi:6-phosphogluconolactonase (cycloisomerase 2 family)